MDGWYDKGWLAVECSGWVSNRNNGVIALSASCQHVSFSLKESLSLFQCSWEVQLHHLRVDPRASSLALKVTTWFCPKQSCFRKASETKLFQAVQWNEKPTQFKVLSRSWDELGGCEHIYTLFHSKEVSQSSEGPWTSHPQLLSGHTLTQMLWLIDWL